jgi:hypothetical protein
LALNAAILVVSLAVRNLREGVAVVIDNFIASFASHAHSCLVIAGAALHWNDADSLVEGKIEAADQALFSFLQDATKDFVARAVRVSGVQTCIALEASSIASIRGAAVPFFV